MDGFDGRIEVEGCDTIPKLFWHQVKTRDGRTAFREKHLGIWRATSWRDYGERARTVGMGLARLGLKRGDVVSVLAETVPEWLYADMGTMGAGGVTNGIYPTDSAKQVDYILNDSRTRFLFVENEEQLDKFLDVRERCPSVAKVIVFDMEGLADFRDPMVMSLDELRCSVASTTWRIPASGKAGSRRPRPRSWRCWSIPRAQPDRPRVR